ncbi:uncharacterized protein LOC117322317 [Pecten maximus]|uniref:uncharacterized protein LOC117322317 n=1 Tax=Pecten maximus TaxID=6579 RepID=UPI0014590264|nr:uncharacterized protein LOC117322317 [Pecten maximus]
MADGDMDDLSQLGNLDNDTIKRALKTRYAKNKIYTNCGDILIAVNPFKDLPIFGKKQHEEYHWKSLKRMPPPHVFYTAARAYRRMQETRTNQVILVEGESGSGKTESTKYMVKHLVSLCPREAGDLHNRIVKINPLLEAFGNAKTTMNNNSSRFAKYLEMTFVTDGHVKGAIVRDYLLEKSRVVDQMDREGNFHIFYCLFAGAPATVLKNLYLKDANTYRILKGNRELLAGREFYKKMYEEQIEVLKSINLEQQDIDIIHTVLAAILLITQVEFEEPDDPNETLKIKDSTPVSNVAELLNVSYEDLGHALIATKQTYVGETVVKRKSMAQAIDTRDAFAKAMYERLFGWIVRQINMNLHPAKVKSSTGSASIGILDIAGFEKLESNSMEQMCINLINERLQSFTNKNVMDFEISIYKEEGIQIPDIKFQNNDALLQLFMKKTFGLLSLLDEESKLGQGSDEKFVKKLKDNYGTHESFTVSPQGRVEFGIRHFAGQVWYDGSNFVEKNRDMLSADITSCMKNSENPFVSDLFSAKKGPTGTISATVHNIRQSRRGAGAGPRKPPTTQGLRLMADLGKSLKERYGDTLRGTSQIYNPKDHKTVISYFQSSMNELLKKLQHAEPYYIKCIKPNMLQQPDTFDEVQVSEQMLYNGISEVAKIRKLGLPVRKRYDDFTKRYRPLYVECRKAKTDRAGTELLLTKVLPVDMMKGIKFGKSRVFMQEDISIWLEKCRNVRERAAADVIAKRWKQYQDEKKRKQDERRSMLERERDITDGLGHPFRQSTDFGHSFKTDTPYGIGDSYRSSLNGLGSTRSTSYSDSEEDDSSPGSTMYFNPIDPKNIASSVGPLKLKELRKKKQAPTPVVDPIPDNNTEDKTEDSKKDDAEFWDIFKIISREAKREDIYTSSWMQILKIITYFVLGTLLLACSVVQKISLVTLTSEEKSSVDRSARYSLLLIAICIPYTLVFFLSLWRSLFGNVPLPSLKSVILVVLVEMLHSIGVSILAFRILPELDVVRGVLLLSCTCMVPSILKPLCSSTKNPKMRYKSSVGKMFEFLLDVLAALGQLLAIPVVVLYEYYIDNRAFVEDNRKILELALALFLCSLSYWENFIDDRFCGALKETNKLQIAMLGLKFDLQECRPIVYVVATPMKIAVTVVVAFLYLEQDRHLELQWAFDIMLGRTDESSLNYTSVACLILSAYIGHYIAYTACKLQMQIMSYAVPLLLSTPVAVAILYLDCEYNFLINVSNEDRTCDPAFMDTWWHLPAGAGWLITVYWVGRHIWFPYQDRLAKLEHLFMSPIYCGVIMEQDLIMNRRRHTRKITKVNIEGQTCYRLNLDRVKSGKDEEEIEDTIPPMIYACGTMWHETRQEMVQLLKSLFRMDKDQFLRKRAVETFNIKPSEVKYYEFEPHILFDDAFETNDDDVRVPNSFVNLLVELMEEAASSVHERAMTIQPPFKIPTPYGGQLVYLMPGNNLMFIHLKDKNKIRHRKRWSQVMYMYYLLGYRILKECQELVLTAMRENRFNDLASWRDFEGQNTGKVEKSQIFQYLDEEVVYRAQNTFLLALDGDVDFTPGAVHMLMDKMKKNERVGAACGRIHPIGKGPVVWYQKFEYAVAHWLQKSTEHVLGCVLCSPGCFSMFRGSAIMDDNVMRKYTILPSEASHHLMYDQGEDRWLCTLLLQQGYRVDYAAASDAFTYAPEGFDEFFNQRRRWMPSTIANILDLLQDGKNTVAANNNISWLYIFYQGCLMVSTVIGPSTVLMMIAGALVTVFNVELMASYLISGIPAILYFFMCFWVKTKYQLLAAQFLSAAYVFIMMVVFVGCIVTAVKENPFHPSVIFLASLVIIFLISACFHPQEFSCIIFGALYFVCVPMGFLLLVIYSLCNMHVVSWGTREVPKKKTKQELEEEEKLKKEKEERKKQGFLARFMPKLQFQDMFKVINDMQMTKKKEDETAEMLKAMNRNFEALLRLQQNPNGKQPEHVQDTEDVPEIVVSKDPPSILKKKGVTFQAETPIESTPDDVTFGKSAKPTKPKSTERDRPEWVDLKILGSGDILQMNSAEEAFWKGFIQKYLYPLDVDKNKQKETAAKLIELRNSVCAGMAIINLLWIAINFMFQLRKPAVISFPTPTNLDDSELNENNLEIDALGMMFVIFYVLILFIQFIGMLMHRWGTFLHLIAITDVPNPFQKSLSQDIEKGDSKLVAKKVLEFCEKLDSEPMPDYPMDSDDEEEEKKQTQNVLKEVINNLQAKGTRNIPGSSNPLGKSLRGTGLGSSYRTSARNSKGNIRSSEFVRSILRRTAVSNEPLFEGNDKKSLEAVLGATKFNDVEKEAPRPRFGAGLQLQKHFVKEVRNRRLPNVPEDFRRKENGGQNLGQTLQRGAYDPEPDTGTIDSEEIYDTIPAIGTMGKNFAKKFKKYRQQESSADRRAYSMHGRNSRYETSSQL